MQGAQSQGLVNLPEGDGTIWKAWLWVCRGINNTTDPTNCPGATPMSPARGGPPSSHGSIVPRVSQLRFPGNREGQPLLAAPELWASASGMLGWDLHWPGPEEMFSFLPASIQTPGSPQGSLSRFKPWCVPVASHRVPFPSPFPPGPSPDLSLARWQAWTPWPMSC